MSKLLSKILSLNLTFGVIILSGLLSSCTTEFSSTQIQPERKVHKEFKWLVENGSNTKIQLVNLRIFDNLGRVSSQESHSLNDNSFVKSEFSYSPTSNSASETRISFNSDSVELNRTLSEIRFNDQGNTIERIVISSGGGIEEHIHFYYNDNGKLERQEEVSAKGNPNKLIFDYNYDKTGKLSELVVFDNFAQTKSRDSLSYPRRNTIERFKFNSNGELTKIIEYTYDISGRLRFEIERNSLNVVIRTFAYEYIFFD